MQSKSHDKADRWTRLIDFCSSISRLQYILYQDNIIAITAGVAKPGQRREMGSNSHMKLRCHYKCMTGLPHPLGVRGFKTHLPHFHCFKCYAIMEAKYMSLHRM